MHLIDLTKHFVPPKYVSKLAAFTMALTSLVAIYALVNSIDFLDRRISVVAAYNGIRTMMIIGAAGGIALAVRYNRFMFRLYPRFLLLLIAVTLGINTLGLILHSRYNRLESSTLMRLTKGEDHYALAEYLYTHYKSPVLVVPVQSDLLEKYGIYYMYIHQWGGLESIETRSYGASLSQDEANILINLDHDEVESSSHHFILLKDEEHSENPLWLFEYENTLFFVPENAIPKRLRGN